MTTDPLPFFSIPDDLPRLCAGATRVTPSGVVTGYHFCTRCWMPLAPVRRCRCAPEPYPPDATPARVLAEHPAVRTLAEAVARGDYRDDTATAEHWRLDFLLWRRAQGKIGEG